VVKDAARGIINFMRVGAEHDQRPSRFQYLAKKGHPHDLIGRGLRKEELRFCRYRPSAGAYETEQVAAPNPKEKTYPGHKQGCSGQSP
jgi:hypothetical protein